MKIIDTDWNEAKLIYPEYLSYIEVISNNDIITEGIFYDVIRDMSDNENKVLFLISKHHLISEQFIIVKYWRYI